MAGEIPDDNDLQELFPNDKKEEAPEEEEMPNDNDDVTTNYTGYQPTTRDPRIIIADEDNVEIENDEPI